MFTIIASILLFPILTILSLAIFAVSFLKVGLQTFIGIFLGKDAVEIPEISLKIID